MSNASKFLNDSEAPSVSSFQHLDTKSLSKKSIADKMQIEFNKESEHLAELRKRNSKIISFTCIQSDDEQEDSSNADQHQISAISKCLYNLKDMCVKEESDESQVSVCVTKEAFIIKSKESFKNKQENCKINEQSIKQQINQTIPVKEVNTSNDQISKQFSLLLDRLKVRKYEEERSKNESEILSKRTVRNNDWNYQQYNTPFRYEYDSSNKKSPVVKLHSKIDGMKSVKRSNQNSQFINGIDVKEFGREIKDATEIDSKFYNKLKNKGIIRKRNKFTKIRIKSPDDLIRRKRLNIETPDDSSEDIDYDKLRKIIYKNSNRAFSNPSASNREFSNDKEIKSFAANIRNPNERKRKLNLLNNQSRNFRIHK